MQLDLESEVSKEEFSLFKIENPEIREIYEDNLDKLCLLKDRISCYEKRDYED